MLVLITRDLFFGSKVIGTAQMLGVPALYCASLEPLTDLLGPQAKTEMSAVILDLGSGIAPADVMAKLPGDRVVRCMAFGAHVDTAALAAAREAGCDPVWPRSKFTAELPQLLRDLCSGDVNGG